MPVVYVTDSHTIESKYKDTSLYGSRRGDTYGRKIPMRYVVRLDGKGPWRRVYCTVISNSGSYWIVFNDEKLYLRTGDIQPEGGDRV